MPAESPALSPDVAARVRRRIATEQRERRLPALSVGLSRDGKLLLVDGAGDPAPGADVQFRMGSITKTFTAVLVLQLRDEGLLRLDDELDAHLPGTPLGGNRVRDLLGHLSGLTREPGGPFWEASPGGPAAELLASLRPADLVLPGRRAFHYSNLAFGLLGLLVEGLRGAPFPEVLQSRLLAPLGLSRTSWLPSSPYARGWRVSAYADTVREEPTTDTGAMGPAGQLWSTPSDLVRWGGFLADPHPELLDPATVEEMCEPVAMTDPRGWTAGYGLGLQLLRRTGASGDRVLAGHGGSMPGFVAGLMVDRDERVAVAAMGNAWQGAWLAQLAAELVVTVIDEDPRVRPWRPADIAPEIAELAGPWFYRGAPLAVHADADSLHVVFHGASERFVPVGPDLFRGADGGDRGEFLRVRRDEDGRPVVLDIATWLLVRDPDDPRGGP